MNAHSVRKKEAHFIEDLLKKNLVFESSCLTKDRALKVLEVLYLTRFMDDKMGKLVRQNKGATFHLAVSGHEMIGAISALSLVPGTDWGFPYYRDRALVAKSRKFWPLF